MHVLHYLPAIRLEHGGVVRAVLDLTTLLAERGTRVTVATHDDTDAPEAWKAGTPGAPAVLHLGARGAAFGLLDAAQVSAIRDALSGADVVHIHGCWQPANVQVARLAARAGVPHVQSVHGMLDDWSMGQSRLKKRVFHVLAERRTLELAAVVHCTAEAERAQALKWFPGNAGAAFVAPLVFELSPYRVLPGPGAAMEAFGGHLVGDEPVVLFLARIHHKKGVDVFIEAIAELAERGVRCRALIAGTAEDPGYMDRMRSLAKARGVSDRTAFLGMVTGELKTSLYQLADVFAGPTSQENFGFVFVEALACATPVVTTPGVDIHPELAGSGGAVIVDRTAEAFAGAIADLLASPTRRAAMGEAGRGWVLERLAPAAVGAEYERMYGAAVDTRRGAADASAPRRRSA